MSTEQFSNEITQIVSIVVTPLRKVSAYDKQQKQEDAAEYDLKVEIEEKKKVTQKK